MQLKNKIETLTQQYIEDIISIRRYIHAHPELSFQEKETSAFVKKNLKNMEIPFEEGFAEHGILGIIQGEKGAGRTIALRADMDALPVLENNNLSFKSLNKGIMHACGHDIHTACLLGAAKIISSLKDKFSGTILLIFQPGEERIPGGAKLMMEDGLFSQHQPELIIGQHVFPELSAGHVGFRSGSYMASSDEIYIKVKGKGGHAALPHKTVDTVLMASQIVVSLQQIVSRFIPTQIPCVLSFGNVVCNSIMNVIPKEVELQGTFRIMDETWRYKAHEQIKKIAHSIAEGMGGTCKIDLKIGFPSLYNQPEATQNSISYAKDLLGEESVKPLDIRMTAEDFAWYAQKFPACFYRLGVGYPDNTETGGLHSPDFIPNEEAIAIGMKTMSYLAMKNIIFHT